MPFGFDSLPLAALGGVFAAAAAAVWFGGWRLSGYVAALTSKSGIGQAFAGMLLLGGISSMPEVAAVSTSAALGNAPLAVNNLLGTASINIMLLAVADIIYGREALTAVAARPAVLMQGVLSMLLATAVAMVATAGDVAIWGVGAGSTVIAIGALVALRLSARFEQRHVWEVVDGETVEDEEAAGEDDDKRSVRRLVLSIVSCGALILVAGFFLASSADAMATRTGLAAGLVGFVLVGLATSLPEISTITAAVRMRRYQMALGDVFGTNIFNMLLIFLADLVYAGKPVLGPAARFEVTGAILAVFLTGIFIVGLLERRDKAIFRMGYDSFAAVIVFAIGLFALSRWAG